ncbi:MAG: NAD-dependent epimerase/dehydratase family protein [Armatimonadota bacterium]
MPRLKVFVTGTTGRVGRVLVPALREHYALVTLHRRPAPDDPTAVLGDLSDRAHLVSLMVGCDVVLHLAAMSRDAPFAEEIVPANIVGAYNVFQAATDAGVRRIVYASSCHVGRFKTGTHTIDPAEPYEPETIYGVSKAFGEVLGRYYHDHHGLEFIAIRIGWLLPYDDPELRTREGKRRIWLSHRDGIALFRLAIEKPGVGFAVVSGTSITSREILTLRSAREILGYEPQDDVVALYGPGEDR